MSAVWPSRNGTGSSLSAVISPRNVRVGPRRRERGQEGSPLRSTFPARCTSRAPRPMAPASRLGRPRPPENEAHKLDRVEPGSRWRRVRRAEKQRAEPRRCRFPAGRRRGALRWSAGKSLSSAGGHVGLGGPGAGTGALDGGDSSLDPSFCGADLRFDGLECGFGGRDRERGRFRVRPSALATRVSEANPPFALSWVAALALICASMSRARGLCQAQISDSAQRALRTSASVARAAGTRASASGRRDCGGGPQGNLPRASSSWACPRATGSEFAQKVAGLDQRARARRPPRSRGRRFPPAPRRCGGRASVLPRKGRRRCRWSARWLVIAHPRGSRAWPGSSAPGFGFGGRVRVPLVRRPERRVAVRSRRNRSAADTRRGQQKGHDAHRVGGLLSLTCGP